MKRFAFVAAALFFLVAPTAEARPPRGSGFSFGYDSNGNSWTNYDGGSWGYVQDNRGNMINYNRIGSSTFMNGSDGSSGYATRIGSMTFYNGSNGQSGYVWSNRRSRREEEPVPVPVYVPVQVPVYVPQQTPYGTSGAMGYGQSYTPPAGAPQANQSPQAWSPPSRAAARGQGAISRPARPKAAPVDKTYAGDTFRGWESPPPSPQKTGGRPWAN